MGRPAIPGQRGRSNTRIPAHRKAAVDGSLAAHDAQTGKPLYSGAIAKGYHWPNMVAAGGKIYATSQDGVTDVIQAGREFKKVATDSLPDAVFASPAVSGGRIYLRGYGYLWAIGTK